MGTLSEATVWREATLLPVTLQQTLNDSDGIDALAAAIGSGRVRRVVAAGNGASWYAALALSLAALRTPGDAPDVLAVPGGLLACGDVAWREGDFLLAFSSSGEFRDVIEAIDHPATPRPFAVITANPGSTLGQAAAVVTRVHVRSQEAMTHTQGYCGAALAALAAWASATSDRPLERAVAAAPELAARSLAAARPWAEAALDRVPRPTAALAFGPGPAWASALEAALLLAEIALIPAQGVELREGATSAMFSLGVGQLVLSIPAGTQRLVAEAESVCERRGATVLRVPLDPDHDPRLAFLDAFAAPLALATLLAQRDGLNPDLPAWHDDYLATAREEG